MSASQIVATLRTKQAGLQDVIDHLKASSDFCHVTAVLRFSEVDATGLQFPAHVDLSRVFKR